MSEFTQEQLDMAVAMQKRAVFIGDQIMVLRKGEIYTRHGQCSEVDFEDDYIELSYEYSDGDHLGSVSLTIEDLNDPDGTVEKERASIAREIMRKEAEEVALTVAVESEEREKRKAEYEKLKAEFEPKSLDSGDGQ